MARVTIDYGAPVVAEKDVTVPDPTSPDSSHGRLVMAGQPVPFDLLEGYAKASGAKVPESLVGNSALVAKLADEETAVARESEKAIRGPEVNKAQAAPRASK